MQGQTKVTSVIAVMASLLVSALLFGFGGYYFGKRLATSPPPLPSPTPTQQEVIESTPTPEILADLNCTGTTIADEDVGFSVQCLPQLKRYTYRNAYSPAMKKQEKMVFFCETPINAGIGEYYYRCPSGGVMIWANGDGWGGGCDVEFDSKITINGQQKSFCLSKDRFGQLYSGDMSGSTGNRFLIEGSFSPSFTKQDALNMVSSFTIL